MRFVGRLLLDHLDDVVAELRLDEVADLAGRQGEGDLVELRDHLALREKAQITALDLAAVVFGKLRRELGEVRATFDLGEQILRLFLHRRIVLAFGLEKDVTRLDLFGRRVLLLVVLVIALHVLRRHDGSVANRLQIEHRVPHLALLRNAVVVLVLFELLRDLGVGRSRLSQEFVGRERDDGELHFLVAFLVFRRDLGLRHRHPVRQRALQLAERQASADFFLELRGPAGRIRHLQQLPVSRVADELTVLLERRKGEDPRAHFLVARRDPETVRLCQRRLFIDQLLQDATIDSHLLEQTIVDVAAVGPAVGLHLLLVDAPELTDRDGLSLD